VAATRPNLAKRPFVDARAANVVAVVLLLAAVALTATSVRTVNAYLAGSKRSRESVAALRAEIGTLEASRREAEQKLSRFDLAGLKAGAEEANELARLRTFSWTRFLTRLERTLPNDVRVETIRLSRPKREQAVAPTAAETFDVSLRLVSSDPDVLPRLVRTFYGSPYFDAPTPLSEAGGERGSADGRTFSLDVVYRDRETKP